MTWTLEQTEHVVKRWTQGATAQTIADELNKTRNAIMGKVSRLGLSGKIPVVRKPAHTVSTSSQRRKKQTLHSVGKLLENIQPNECRWPMEKDGRMFFCAEERISGSSYCEKHYLKSIRRKEKNNAD